MAETRIFAMYLRVGDVLRMNEHRLVVVNVGPPDQGSIRDDEMSVLVVNIDNGYLLKQMPISEIRPVSLISPINEGRLARMKLPPPVESSTATSQ